MTQTQTILLTAIAPIIWGSSYLVTTQMLPNMDAISVAALRALPAGVLLMLLVRQVPRGHWIPKMLILGALNFSVFWCLMFFAAYRLPGGVAAVLGAIQPFVVIFLAYGLLGSRVRPLSVVAALTGLFGVGLLVLGPDVQLDPLGIGAGLLGAGSMALGTVLSRKWQPPVSALTFTAWQLTAGGLLLVPVALFSPMDWAGFSVVNALGLAYLGLIGAALTYVIWLRGIARLPPASVAILGFLSPISASFLGWYMLDERLNTVQLLGVAAVLVSVFSGQIAQRPRSGD